MKSIVVWVLIASGIGSSLSEISEESFINVLNDLKTAEGPDDLGSQILHIFIKPSFDSKCVYDRCNERNITERIFEELNIATSKQKSNGERIPSDNDEAADFVMLSILFTCSSKLDVLLETVFDIAMSFNPLVKAFIDDSSYDEYLQMLNCANSHAVDSNILDSSAYDFKHEVPPQNQDECNEWIDLKNEWISGQRLRFRKYTGRPCSIRIASAVEKILIKNVLLVQVELTEQQKNQERSTFVMQTRQVLQDILTCALQNPRPN
jgi:hypothetical protein